MAFISHLYSQQNFSGRFPAPANALPMCNDDTCLPDLFFNNCGITVPPEYDTTSTSTTSPSSMASFPERLGVSDMVVPTSPEIITCLSSGYHPIDHKQLEDHEYIYTSGCISNSWSSNPFLTNDWETGSKTSKEIEEPIMKNGRYSKEERKDKIMRFLKKRNQRNFTKTIKVQYECRKTLADKRIRVRGRFAKNTIDHQHCDDPLVLPEKTGNPCDQDVQLLCINNFPVSMQMKQDYDQEEQWLQEEEAMACLLYSPYITIPNN